MDGSILDHPAITLVMPVYNVSPYVERCLLSIMQQTRPASECLIVDDASTDDSITKCERLLAAYDGPTRFTILHHDHNRGLSAARNTGTDAATCPYIYYVDSDDEMTLDCLEKLSVPAGKDNRIEMVLGDHRFDMDAMPSSWWRRWAKSIQYSFMEDTPDELHSNEELRQWFYHGKFQRPVCVWNKLLKLKFIKDNGLYNKEGLLFEDQLWSYYLMRSLNHAAFVHDVTYLHHRRPGSICTGTDAYERRRHYGLIYREIANNVVPGQRIEELEHYVRPFCSAYLESTGNPDYQYAFSVFRRELSDGQHRFEVFLLDVTNTLGKSQAGRLLFKAMLLVRRIFRRALITIRNF